jgi:porin
MCNTTEYRNAAMGGRNSGNYCGYVLMDYQLQRSDQEHPSHGLYVGASIMTVPDSLNPYARYYEARLYKEAPFQRRPADLLSVVASRTGYSRYFTDNLVAQGKTVWRAQTTLTGSYSMHVSPGNNRGFALSYVYGPAITPRVPNAFKGVATWTVFF